MRASLVFLTLLIPVSVQAYDDDLLERFKQQNERNREQVKADIKSVLDKAQAVEKSNPAEALRLLQELRDRLLEKGQLTTRADRVLAEPLWERVQGLVSVVRSRTTDELRASLADFKEYESRLREQFLLLREESARPGKEAPAGQPMYLAYPNGKTAVGWLHHPPAYCVHCSLNEQASLLSPGVVAGVQTADAFYLHNPATRRFVKLGPAEFFVTAVASYPRARKAGFWVSWDAPSSASADRRSVGGAGQALFSRSTGVLMTTWSRPDARLPELGAARSSSPELARLYREVMVELKVQEAFARLKRADRERCREVVLSFLERRPHNEPLSAEEIGQFSDLLGEIHPERRPGAAAFAQLLNRVLHDPRSK